MRPTIKRWFSDLVWGPGPWGTQSGGSTGWDPRWIAHSCHAFHRGWSEPSRQPGNWNGHSGQPSHKNGARFLLWYARENVQPLSLYTLHISTFVCQSSYAYSRMAIFSECRDDTEDMLWDIYKERTVMVVKSETIIFLTLLAMDAFLAKMYTDWSLHSSHQ